MEKIIAFLDYELDYATQLAAYLNAHRRFPYRVMVFAAEPELSAFLKKCRVDTLAAAAEYAEEARELAKEQGIARLFFLTEREEEGAECIYRFQSAEKIRRLLQREEEQKEEQGEIVKAGVFSPAAQTEKSRFARALALAYAKRGRTFLLSLEAYGAWEESEAGGMSELIFYAKQRSGNLAEWLRSLNGGAEEYTEACSARYAEDLFGFGKEELAYLLACMEKEGNFRTLLCDVGLLGAQSLELLALCDVIFIPVFPEKAERERQEAFMRQLKETGNGRLLKRIVEVYINRREDGAYAAEAEEALRKGGRLLGGAGAANLREGSRFA